jgi:hypothetical protein
MGALRFPDPALLVVAVFSRHVEALDWAADRLEGVFGAIQTRSERYGFCQTRYYEPSMGEGLQKQLLLFRKLAPLDALASIKRQTNALEEEAVRLGTYAEARPINLDPGLLTSGKFQLATTKDQAHRIYLGEGIFGEVTLRFEDGHFTPWPWTYADYRLPAVLNFLGEGRRVYLRLLRESAT